MTERLVNVKRCGACAQDHIDVEAFALPAPIPQPNLISDQVVTYTHRFECPTTGRVVLLAL